MLNFCLLRTLSELESLLCCIMILKSSFYESCWRFGRENGVWNQAQNFFEIINSLISLDFMKMLNPVLKVLNTLKLNKLNRRSICQTFVQRISLRKKVVSFLYRIKLSVEFPNIYSQINLTYDHKEAFARFPSSSRSQRWWNDQNHRTSVKVLPLTSFEGPSFECYYHLMIKWTFGGGLMMGWWQNFGRQIFVDRRRFMFKN